MTDSNPSRKHTVESLRESEEKFRDVFEAANVGKSITRPTGEISVNKTFADMLGYRREELENKNWQELTPPEDIAATQAMIDPLLKGVKDAVRFNKRYLHRNGTTVWTDVSTVLRRGEDGNPKYFITTVVDITARKQAEEELRLSEERFSSAFHSSPAGLTITRVADGLFVDVNETFCRMFEFNHEEVIGHTSTDLNMWTPEDRKTLIKRQQETGGLQVFELQARARSGRIVDILFSSKPMDMEGVLYHVTTMIDITERKLAEEERQKFVMLVESSKEFIGMCDLDFNPLYVNPAGVRMVGLPDMAAASQLKVQDYFFPEDRQFIEEEFFPRVLREGHGDVEIRLRHFQTGEPIWMFYYLFAVHDASGMTIGWATVSHDITERKRMYEEKSVLEEQLQQAQKLESVGRLAGGVAHDFNNILGVIIGYGDMILEQLHREDPMWEDLQAIVAAAHRAATLTSQLLAFSRKQTLQPEVLDLNALITNLDKMLRRLIGEDILLELALADDIYPVLADPGQVEQVIMNLSVNARDSMPTGGALIVETANVTLDETYVRNHEGTKPGEYAMLAVTDAGHGISKEVVAQIFEPFFTTKEKGRGTGLGLATVYGIVKQSGGNIWVYSEPEKGTTFKVYLPKTGKSRLPQAKKVEKASLAGKGEHILVVEDEDSLRKLAYSILSRAGYTVTLAANGGEALLLVEEKGLNPDLIITDVVMPNMSGQDMVDRLNRNRPYLKALYMSGYTDNAIVHHGVLDSAVHFIQKPFSVEAFLSKVRQVLEEKPEPAE